LSKFNPDVVINTAAMTHVDQCENNQEACWRLNVEAVQYLADATDDLNIHFIHISTDFIFDGKAGPYKEEDEPNPLSYYGKSKLASEEVVQAKKGSWSILRTVLVYGYTPNLSRTNIVLWAKGALEQGQTLNVVDDQFRTPTLAEDLAKACLLAAEHKAQGVYHISGEDFFSVIDIVYGVADFWNLDKSLINRVNSQILAQPANRPPKTGFIITKAMDELGFAPLSFQAGLAVVDACLKK
jgi:dTDP-4-dehydrorhamnose reductase